MSTAAAPDLFRESLKAWPRGTVLNTRLGERLSRQEIRFRMIRRAFSDPTFERELIANTREVFAVVFDECLGIDRYKFMNSIVSFPVLQETPTCLYMEVPTCHRGCAMPGASTGKAASSTECNICEKAFPLPADQAFVLPEVRSSESLTRRSIEGHIQKRAVWDAGFATSMYAAPLETYTRYASQLCSGRLPRYLAGIREIRLVHETSTEMYLILPTREGFAQEHDC